MTAARFAALRARTVRDAAFRGRLRADFVRALQDENLFGDLTQDQREELRFVLLLHGALKAESAPRIDKPAVVSAFTQRRLHAVPKQPISIDEWRARRTVNG